jgi:hypothetical protein
MLDAAQIREHAEVLDSDGARVGTVDHVDKGAITLTKSDSSAGGLHHYIPLAFVQSVTDGTVHLDRPAEEAMREWSTSRRGRPGSPSAPQGAEPGGERLHERRPGPRPDGARPTVIGGMAGHQGGHQGILLRLALVQGIPLVPGPALAHRLM